MSLQGQAEEWQHRCVLGSIWWPPLSQGFPCHQVLPVLVGYWTLKIKIKIKKTIVLKLFVLYWTIWNDVDVTKCFTLQIGCFFFLGFLPISLSFLIQCFSRGKKSYLQISVWVTDDEEICQLWTPKNRDSTFFQNLNGLSIANCINILQCITLTLFNILEFWYRVWKWLTCPFLKIS